MKKLFFAAIIAALGSGSALAQVTPAASPTPKQPTAVQQREATIFDVSQYGVAFHVEPRLIIMMAALEAAGFEAGSSSTPPSVFRANVRKDLANLDPDLRARMRTFYERNKLPAPATAADQAARYVSLAFALGQPPTLDAPARSEELPASLLEVLDFAPLVQEFYRRSGIAEKLADYTRAYQAEGDRLRKPTGEMVNAVLSYLHTRPITVSLERVRVQTPQAGKKKDAPRFSTRELERRFYVVPDLLGVPGAINFRVIADEYYVVLPEGTDPASSELRRGYLQYVIDPLLVRFNRAIADRREPIKQLLAAREKAGAEVSPDVFIAVSRSLVAAAEARFDEVRRLDALAREARANLSAATTESARQAITKELREATTAVQDETAARLTESYEKGAVLAFYFADQLKDVEASGFDVANFLADMIASFDPVREQKRLAENAEARNRALAAREARLVTRNAAPLMSEAPAGDTAKSAQLMRQLTEIEQTLRLKDYTGAEARLKNLMREYTREPRIFFALAQTASFAAADAIDEEVQAERLNRALANYRLALEASSPETDRALISRSHEAMGRIYAFLENGAEASREFDEAIKVGDVPGGAYKEALEGKKKLAQPE